MKPNIDKLAREAADAEIAVEKQQPTPTGEQEWTAEKVASFLTTRGGCIGGQGKLADAINASLAAEQEQANKNLDVADSIARASQKVERQLRTELASAQAELRKYVDPVLTGGTAALDAYVVPLVDALEDFAKHQDPMLAGRAKAALAQHKEHPKQLRKQLANKDAIAEAEKRASERAWNEVGRIRAEAQQPLVETLEQLKPKVSSPVRKQIIAALAQAGKAQAGSSL